MDSVCYSLLQPRRPEENTLIESQPESKQKPYKGAIGRMFVYKSPLHLIYFSHSLFSPYQKLLVLLYGFFFKKRHLSLKALLIFLDVLVLVKRSRQVFVKAPTNLSSCHCNRC